MHHDEGTILGIDIGSVSIAAVTLDASGSVLGRSYAFHGGDIEAALARIDKELELSRVRAVAMTGRPLTELRADARYESQVAALESVRARYPCAAAVLVVGGEKYSLARFNLEGEYLGSRSNSGCAAGTGSFLDQQAGRLGLADSPELAGIALINRDEPPKVATRCAVFAKTDLIHAQQEGYSLAAISDGLCRGLARNLVDALFNEDPIRGQVVFTGGVALNDAVLERVRTLSGLDVVRDGEAACHGAIGAALLFLGEGREGSPFVSASALRRSIPLDRSGFHPPLSLHSSGYPDFHAHESYLEKTSARGSRPGAEVEVDVYEPAPAVLEAWLGVDIGSTSTKSALVDRAGRMVAGFYTRTSGRPVEAFQALLEAMERLGERKGFRLDVIGCATTGSGRKFIGGIAGADLALDEISAHARAAIELDPGVDTIIEIGGQDSKFTTLRDGRVTSSIMNNVCAAGTGSFIEEQARKLGVGIGDYADLAAGVSAPRVSDRCTVFMERDINHLLAAGCTVPEVLAAALHSVCENYLRKVAAEKNVGDVVFFQGATAKNRSLVAAFEQRLGKPM
ncbi:MAG: CoA activase, partial [Spirochaetae bacterium HGW-Spirochaetae-7]